MNFNFLPDLRVFSPFMIDDVSCVYLEQLTAAKTLASEKSPQKPALV